MRAPLLVVCLLLVGCGAPATVPAAPVDPASGSLTPSTTASPTSSPVAGPSPSRPPTSSKGTEGTKGTKGPKGTEGTKGPTGTKIIVADSPFGAMLYDASGQAIYLFDAEQSTRPECYDECAVAWPPVLTIGPPQASGQVKSDLLGTTRRRDGTTQVTYAGRPLYFYADEGKYQVLCHDVEGFGGLWLVVQPNGDPAPA